MKFTLSDLPMPPSSNHQYFVTSFIKDGRPFGKLAPSRELKDFENRFGEWRLKNNVLVAKARKFVREEILLKDLMIQIDTYFCFPGTALWTQKGMPKKMDASNRIKALHDCIADALEIDDSWFWEGRFEKIETNRAEPWCFVVLKPWKTRSVGQIKEEEL